MLTVVENYRAMFVSRTRTFFEWLLKACLHPASVCSLRDIQEWLFVWKCYFTNRTSIKSVCYVIGLFGNLSYLSTVLQKKNVLYILQNQLALSKSELNFLCRYFFPFPTRTFPTLFISFCIQCDRTISVLSFNTAEKNEKLLEWVRSRVGPKLQASDFGASWRSGILLCALVESIAPGSCPRYDLLNEDNRFGNAQLAVQLIEKINLRPVSGSRWRAARLDPVEQEGHNTR